MIKLYCDKCGDEVPKSGVTVVQFSNNGAGTKENFHLCRTCAPYVVSLFKEVWPTERSKKSEDKPSDSLYKISYARVADQAPGVLSEETHSKQTDGCAEVKPMRAPRGSCMPEPVYSCTVDGQHITEFFNAETSVCTMKKIPEDEAKRYMKDSHPLNPVSRRDLKILARMLIMFYRGDDRQDIQKKLIITTQQFCIAMDQFCSIHAYRRWFNGSTYTTKSGIEVDAGQVLVMVGAGLSFKDIIADTGCRSNDDVIEVLEYYFDFEFGPSARCTLIERFGG